MRVTTVIATGLVAAGCLALSCAGGAAAPSTGASTGDIEADKASPSAEGKSALLVIAPADFQDQELAGTRTALEDAGVRISIGSTVTTPVTGMSGMVVTPEVLIADADAAAVDAVVFIGGSGTAALLDNADAQGLAKATLAAGKLLAAICMAPEILANAGLLDGKRATCWDGGLENLAAKGATVVKEPVVVDGDIITGDGPDAAGAFGKAIAEALSTR